MKKIISLVLLLSLGSTVTAMDQVAYVKYVNETMNPTLFSKMTGTAQKNMIGGLVFELNEKKKTINDLPANAKGLFDAFMGKYKLKLGGDVGNLQVIRQDGSVAISNKGEPIAVQPAKTVPQLINEAMDAAKAVVAEVKKPGNEVHKAAVAAIGDELKKAQ